MSLTIIITSDVQGRYRGFLGSTMLELAPGIYISPRMNEAVRERLWDVISGWHGELNQGSLTLIWRDKAAAGGVAIKQCGEPPKVLVEVDGLLLARREIKTGTD
jgi:CRISPR-associated protein Cas2